jgi:hypothetical protein
MQLAFRWENKVDGIADEWNHCFYNQQAMRSFALQKALESADLPETEYRHLIVTDEKGVAMVIPCCTVRLNLLVVASPWINKVVKGIRIVWPKFLYARLFIVGSSMSTCGDNIGIRDMDDTSRWPKQKIRAVFDEIRRKARSMKISFVIIKEPAAKVTNFVKRGVGGTFFFPESLPTAYLELPKCGYMQAISTRYRNKLKKRRKVAVDKGLYWIITKTADGLFDRMFDLHSQIMDHAKVVFERLNRKFFDKAREFIEKDPAKDTFYSLGFRRFPDGTQKLICCEFAMIEGDTMYPLYTGFDYEIKKDTSIYFNAFYALIDEAERRGLKRIHFGQTACEVKAELGCVPERLYIGVHHSNPVFQGIIWLLRGLLFETESLPQRDVWAATLPQNSGHSLKPAPVDQSIGA